jgi:hypothetical protein
MKKSQLKANEFDYFYATYLNAIKDVELLEGLQKGSEDFNTLIDSLSSDILNHRYAPGKWTINEVLQHIIDTERVFQYRAFRFSKNDKTPLPGFDQDDYVIEGENNKGKQEILNEYNSVRAASLSLFKDMPNHKLERIGTASGMPWSVAALGFVISGHQKHHLNIIQERYLKD